MAPLDQMTEVLHAEVARFPRAKLAVVKGPDKGVEVLLEGQTVVVGSDESCQLRLSDPSVSRRHVELSGGPGGYRLRDLRSTNGVFIEGVQVLDARLSDKTRFTVGRNELRFEPERSEVQWPLSVHERFGEVLGKSLVMRRVFALLERASATESPIVLEGEAGTGKEVLARAIHERSPRREGPFVVVDLGASNEALMESDLFGHDVSSARPVARPGAIEEAEGGTLYLDEVTELPNALQARLLRALETKEFKRPGQGGVAKVDVRVVASTQKDLDVEVKAGRFREDLSFRLSVFRVRVPPLRERPDDIPQLVRHFEAKARAGTALSDETVEMLTRHDWPGNVRELRSVLERLAAFPDLGAGAIARALGKSLDTGEENSGAKLRNEMSQQLLSLPYHEAKDRVLESFEKTYLLEHLKAANGVVTRAAQRAGLPRQSVHRMLRRLGINTSDE
ncbi:MAG: sigma 54-interacting transcriptional regulator [Myxococcaceae bacterium]|jgi:DNA-binding NtrC family response regulator|nr:sigma 54-interacting transcriptional regulator [Myxococcaceae bacterium]